RLAKESSILPALERAGFLNRYGGLPEDVYLKESTLRLLQYFSQQKETALQSGRISQEQFIEPGFVFASARNGELIVLPFGAAVPRGYFLSWNNADLVDG